MYIALIILLLSAETYAERVLFIDLPAQVNSVTTYTYDTTFVFGGGVRFGGTIFEIKPWRIGGDIKFAALNGVQDGTADVYVRNIYLDLEPRIFIGPLFDGPNYGFFPYASMSYTNRFSAGHTHVFDDDEYHVRMYTQGSLGLGIFMYFYPLFIRFDSAASYGHLGLGFQSQIALGMNLPHAVL